MITFVLGFQDWQWAVGTGVWIDDILDEVEDPKLRAALERLGTGVMSRKNRRT